MAFALYLMGGIFSMMRQSSAESRPLKFGCLQKEPLKFGCDAYRSVYEHICCTVPMHGAERSGFLKTVDFFGQLEKKYGSTPSQIVFYDSQCGIPLYVAPRGRTYAEWKEESLSHLWPSFRDAEVVHVNVNVKQDESWGGELVSKCNTHLGHRFFGGHNLPDSKHTRDCVNLVCMSGSPSAGLNGTESLNLTPLASNVNMAEASNATGVSNVGASNAAGASSNVAATYEGSRSGGAGGGLSNHAQALQSSVSSAGAGASNVGASNTAGASNVEASNVGAPYEVSESGGSGGGLSNHSKAVKSSVSSAGAGASTAAGASNVWATYEGSKSGGSGGGLSNHPPPPSAPSCPGGFHQVEKKDAVAPCNQDWRGKVTSIVQCRSDCKGLYGNGGLFSIWRASDWNYVGEVACQCWHGDCKIVNAQIYSSNKQNPVLSGINTCTLPTEHTKALKLSVSSAGGYGICLPILLVFSILL